MHATYTQHTHTHTQHTHLPYDALRLVGRQLQLLAHLIQIGAALGCQAAGAAEHLLDLFCVCVYVCVCDCVCVIVCVCDCVCVIVCVCLRVHRHPLA